MVVFKAINSQAEVSGDAVISVVEGVKGFQEVSLKILESCGLTAPKRGSWYLQQTWLNAFKVISEKVGKNTLFMIGQDIPKTALWPPNVNTIEKALASIDIAYHIFTDYYNHLIGILDK